MNHDLRHELQEGRPDREGRERRPGLTCVDSMVGQGGRESSESSITQGSLSLPQDCKPFSYKTKEKVF